MAEKLFGFSTGELLIMGGAAYFILRGLGKLPSIGTQAVETAGVDVGNVVLGIQNSAQKIAWPDLTGVYGNQTFVSPTGSIYSTLQTAPSSTYIKNEWGIGTGTLTTTPDALPPNTYTGSNEFGPGIAILTSDYPLQPSGGDWITGLHLW